MPLDPQSIVNTMTPVQRLVYEAVNYDTVDVRRLEAELFDIRRRAFNDELEIQAAKVHCPNRRANLTNPDILNRLDLASTLDAESVANTYNYFIALQIIRIGEENPNASRGYYAERVAKWDTSYWLYKDAVVAMYADQSARAMAQQEFYARNRGPLVVAGMLGGAAKMEPRTAVCPICQGWINRGIVPLFTALNNPPPYHQNCPHGWDLRPGIIIAASTCALLWMGE